MGARLVTLTGGYGMMIDAMAKKKSKNATTEPEHFHLAHEIAEDAIGGPLFQPKRIKIRPPKPLQRRKKAMTKKAHRRRTKKR